MTEIISHLTIIIGILVMLINIITEVIKSVVKFKDEKGINIFVLLLSEVVTITTLTAYFQYADLLLTWYVVVAFVVVGFMVAYAAMFGFDKLLKYFEQIGKE